MIVIGQREQQSIFVSFTVSELFSLEYADGSLYLDGVVEIFSISNAAADCRCLLGRAL